MECKMIGTVGLLMIAMAGLATGAMGEMHDSPIISGLPPSYVISGCDPLAQVNVSGSFPVSTSSIESIVMGGDKVYTGSSAGVLSVIDLRSKTIENVTIGSSISSLALSQDGMFVTAGSSNGTIRLFDTSSLGLVRTMAHGSTGVWGIAVHDDLIISGGGDRRIVFWNASTGLQELEVKASSSVRAISMQNDGPVAVGLYNGEISLIDPHSHNLTKLYAHTSIVRSLSWSDDGSMLASVSSDKTLRIWNSDGNVTTVNASTSGIYGVAWSDERIITAGTDEHFRIWSAQGSMLKDFKIGSSVHALGADGPSFTVGDIRGRVTLLSDTTLPSLLSSSLHNESTNSTIVYFSGRFSECVSVDKVSIVPEGQLGSFNLTSINGTIDGIMELKDGASDGTYKVILNDVQDLSGNSIDEVDIGGFTLDRTAPCIVSLTQSRPSPVPQGKLELVAWFSEQMMHSIDVVLMHNGSDYDVTSVDWPSDGLSLIIALTLTKDMPGGEYTIQLGEGRDVAGNVMQDFESTFTYDPEPPVAEAGSDITINTGESATLDASNSTGAIKFVWSIKGREYPGMIIEHRFYVPGKYPVLMIAFDDAGNSDSDSLTVYVIDVDLPNISIEKPKKVTNESEFVIRYNITDLGGVSMVEVMRDSAFTQPATERRLFQNALYVDDRAEIPLPNDGLYNLSVKACDAAGNCNLTGPFELLRDSISPLLLSYSPDTASSSDIELVLLFSEKVNVSRAMCSGSAMPVVLADGGDEIRLGLRSIVQEENYSLSIKVQDIAGNALTTNFSFNVRVDANDFIGPAVGFFSAGFTFAFLLALFAMRKRKVQIRRVEKMNDPINKEIMDRTDEELESAIRDLKVSSLEDCKEDLL